jgi:DivIVA domain-containing protein
MSILDMDISARRTPQSIRKRRFAVVRRGFDPDQVQGYLEQIAGWIEQLEAELHTAREEIDASVRRAEQPIDPYGRMGARVAELMRTAEEQAHRIRQEAEDEASRKLDDLQGEVARIREEARSGAARLQREAEEESNRVRAEAAQTLDRARAEANSVLAALTGQRDMLVAELRSTRTRLSELVDGIDATVGATPVFPLGGPLDPWREIKSGLDFSPPAPPEERGPEPAPEPPPVRPVASPFDSDDSEEHVDRRAEAPLFDEFTEGPSYEGTGTGQPLFDDPEFRPRGFDVWESSDVGEPASFELPAGEALDLGGYAEDDPETTPTINLSLPDIPSFDDGEEGDEPEGDR